VSVNFTSLQADIVEAWLLKVNDVKLRTVKHVEHDVEARVVKGWLEEADHSIVTQSRAFIGLINHSPETGEERTGFSWYVGNGRTLSFNRVTRVDNTAVYVCVSDRLEIDDHIVGSGWQVQTWELQSKFKPVAGSYFEEVVEDADEPEDEYE